MKKKKYFVSYAATVALKDNNATVMPWTRFGKRYCQIEGWSETIMDDFLKDTRNELEKGDTMVITLGITCIQELES